MACMDTILPSFAQFEAAERARGASEVLRRDWPANRVVAEHTHPFRARALVVVGEMWLTCEGEIQHLLPGDRFEVPAGAPHSERYGPEGATFWVSRTNAA
jgi:quercetin dioxygenase-like cupin family protein